MITEKDLKEAIAECEGYRHPTASTCLKLAAYYTILGRMEDKGEAGSAEKTKSAGYSFSAAPVIHYSNTEFSRIVEEKGIERCFPVLDELMNAILLTDTPLYRCTIRKLQDV